MSKTAVVFTCAHSDPAVDNKRFGWLGQLIYDLRPDYVFDLGDFEDMRSLNTYDTRYPQAIVSQNYQRDIEHGQKAKELIWGRFREMKRKRPHRVGFEGNHENRIKRAIAHDPRIEGDKYGISFGHLQTDYWFDDYHEYENGQPQLVDYDGVMYGHFVTSGGFGRPMATKHHAASLIDKTNKSTTVGHSHQLHFARKASAYPRPINGLVAGCFKGADEPWAGQQNREWSKGVVIKRNIEDGQYDMQWISLAALEKEYG